MKYINIMSMPNKTCFVSIIKNTKGGGY